VGNVSDIDGLPGLAEVREAAERLRGVAAYTPLVEFQILNERVGGRVLLKMESLQRTGSFKFRGAYNRITRLTVEEKARGIIAFSSGNHAQGVAAAALLAGTPALILMPDSAPTIKVEGTRAYGAEVRFYEYSMTWAREALAHQLAAERGATIVPPYDHPDIIAGQGTVALELLDQARALNASIDVMIAPCSGGGLMAGCAIVMSRQSPGAKLYTVEPLGFEDTARSLVLGKRVANEPGACSVCDSLLISPPGKLTFAINYPLLAGGLVVTDEEVADAMAFAFHRLKLVLEPGGATGLAAVLCGKVDTSCKTVALVCSGGNVDAATFCSVLSRSITN